MASTCGGNPVSSAASLAALDVYRRSGAYAQLFRVGAYLREQLQRVLVDMHMTGTILGDGPLAQVAFTAAAACDYRSSRHADPAFARRVMLGLFQRRIFINPMSTKFYLSLAHDEASCDEFAAAFAGAIAAAK
jgi:glutamate-1-semialdehyde 2,1-aminomutase